jgi:hypothetical protein
VSYRDEKEALRARVRTLQGDLAAAERKIARLSGEAEPAGPEEQLSESGLLGAPTGIVLERELPFSIDEHGYEAIALAVRSRLGVEVAQVGGSLTTPGDVFTLIY